MMDFKEEQDKIFSQISSIRNGVKPEGIKSEGDLNNCLGILTGTSLWLLSNADEISDINAFREKIDSFKRVLDNPLYMGMERNLCVASGVMKHVDGSWSSNDFDGFANIAGVSVGLPNTEYGEIVKARYDEAAGYFAKLNEDEEVRKDAENCHFAMNFKFDGDCSGVATLYSAVSVFRDVASELDNIYERKLHEGSKKVNKVNSEVKRSM